MIIDCFTFWKELDILEIRLNELYSTVDYFVLVEATHTQSLQPKPLYFEENKQKFSKFLDKIIHIKVENTVDISQYPWAFENYQRSCISQGLNQLNLDDNDIVLISDVDEIPSANALKNYLPNLNEILCFGMTYNVYYLNLIMRHKVWTGTVATKWKFAKQIDPHPLIKIRDRLPQNLIIPNTGWHLGYQGGEEIIFEKYFSCIEPFNKNDIPSKELFSQIFKEYARNGGCFIFCDNLSRKDLTLDQIEIKSGNLPDFIINNQDKFKSYLLS